MKILKTILIIAIMSILSNSVYAQNWTKETFDEFLKDKNVAVVVDLSEATIMDVSISDYPEYFSGKYSSNEKYAVLVLEKFKKRFISGFYQKCDRNRVSAEDARYVVTYKFQAITDNGGATGIYWVSDNGNKTDTIAFGWKDGRWNDFETLLMENIDIFWKTYGEPGNPYYDVKSILRKKDSRVKFSVANRR